MLKSSRLWPVFYTVLGAWSPCTLQEKWLEPGNKKLKTNTITRRISCHLAFNWSAWFSFLSRELWSLKTLKKNCTLLFFLKSYFSLSAEKNSHFEILRNFFSVPKNSLDIFLLKLFSNRKHICPDSMYQGNPLLVGLLYTFFFCQRDSLLKMCNNL